MSETALFLTISKVRHRKHIHIISVKFEPSMIILKKIKILQRWGGWGGCRPASHAFRMFSIPGREGALLTSQNYKTPKFPIPDLNIEKRKKKRKGTVNMDSD